jgi:small neutral amino acid transporter SnatA (MarC family)
MLWSNVNFSFNCCIGVIVLVTLCAMYAYYVDSKRLDGDPKKKNYHPLAILFAPITLPLFIVFYISIFILRVVTYGVFVVFFILALILVRKPFILEWLKKSAMAIGDRLLEANTLLIRIFLRPLAGSGKSA